MDGLFVLLLLCGLAPVYATDVRQCKNGARLPEKVIINDCIEEPCRLLKGSNTTLKVFFHLDHKIENLHPKVRAEVVDFEVDYPIARYGYVFSDVGNVMVYHLELPIPKMYPKVEAQVEFSLYTDVDGQQQTLTCFAVKVKLVNTTRKHNQRR